MDSCAICNEVTDLNDQCICISCEPYICYYCFNNTTENKKCVSCFKFSCNNCTEFNYCLICQGNCSRCHTFYKPDFYATCIKCSRLVCDKCVGLTSCQSSQCFCKDCYDYKCRKCGNKLDISKIYLDDEQPINKCNSCL